MAKLKIAYFRAGERVVDADGKISAFFTRQLNEIIGQLAAAVNAQSEQLELIQLALANAGIAVQTAEEVAADLAATKKQQELQGSYTNPTSVLSAEIDPLDATKAKITIADHTRIYTSGIEVEVEGGSISGCTLETDYLVTYEDAQRDGINNVYAAVTDATLATQIGDRHCVGGIRTPASGATTPTTGEGSSGPGIPRRWTDQGFEEV